MGVGNDAKTSNKFCGGVLCGGDALIVDIVDNGGEFGDERGEDGRSGGDNAIALRGVVDGRDGACISELPTTSGLRMLPTGGPDVEC